MTLYLTYNDYPSGIYSSQVIDVIQYVKQRINSNIRLIAFVSLRNYFSVKTLIKAELKDAIVIPMFPKVINWEKNYYLLVLYCYFLKPNAIIGRSVLATQLALKIKKKGLISKVIYDGRGAIAAEWNEYNVVNAPTLLSKIESLEKEVVLKSDFRIAVSCQLIKHWQQVFGYNENKHVIIPCTINKIFEEVQVDDVKITKTRNELGIALENVVFVYSGSVSGWQSFDTLQSFLRKILSENKNFTVIFLSELNEKIVELQKEYPHRVFQKQVPPNKVLNYLHAADYGLLIREMSITNQVSSPVKFAEYLSAGLKVVISEHIGDYSDFVRDHNCGHVLSRSNDKYDFCKLSLSDRDKNIQLAKKYFFKINYFNAYSELCKHL